MQYLRKYSFQIIILLSILFGLGLKYLPIKYQMIIGVPLFLALIIYSAFAGESIYSKLIYIYCAVLGLLYLIGISINGKTIQVITTILSMLVMLCIFIIPKIHNYKSGLKKGAWTVLDISAIVILTLMILLFILAQIF